MHKDIYIASASLKIYKKQRKREEKDMRESMERGWRERGRKRAGRGEKSVLKGGRNFLPLVKLVADGLR